MERGRAMNPFSLCLPTAVGNGSHYPGDALPCHFKFLLVPKDQLDFSNLVASDSYCYFLPVAILFLINCYFFISIYLFLFLLIGGKGGVKLWQR